MIFFILHFLIKKVNLTFLAKKREIFFLKFFTSLSIWSFKPNFGYSNHICEIFKNAEQKAGSNGQFHFFEIFWKKFVHFFS